MFNTAYPVIAALGQTATYHSDRSSKRAMTDNIKYYLQFQIYNLSKDCINNFLTAEFNITRGI